MVSFGHTAVGVIVGYTAYSYLGQDNLVSGLLITGTVGVVSHYVMDFIPHGHFFRPKDYKKSIAPVIIFDLFLSIILFLGLIYYKQGLSVQFFYAMFGIGGSQLPDVIDGLIYTKRIKAKGLLKVENNFHQSLHWHGQGSRTLLLGMRDIWQVLIILIALGLTIGS